MHLLPAKKAQATLPMIETPLHFDKNNYILGFYKALLEGFYRMYDDMTPQERKEVALWLRQIDPLSGE